MGESLLADFDDLIEENRELRAKIERLEIALGMNMRRADGAFKVGVESEQEACASVGCMRCSEIVLQRKRQ